MSRAIRKRRPDVQKGAYYEGLVATRCANLTATSAGTKIMARTSHIATCDIRRLKIACQNFRVPPGNVDGQEVIVGGAATITAAIEYPTGVFSQILFSGQVQATMPGLSIRESDYCTPTQMIPIGATFWIRQFYTNSVLLYSDGIAKGSLNADTTLGDIINFSSPTPVDMTMGGTIPQENASRVSMPPAAIIGVTNQPSVIVVGDSGASGFNEVTNVKDMRMGLVCRGLPATSLAFLNHASSGVKASTLHTNSYLLWSPLRRTLWKYGTHLIDAMGFNDIYYDSDSAVTVEFSCRNNLWAQMPPRAKIHRTTIMPKSTSTDSWSTAGNQTPDANNSIRVTFDTNVRNGMAGVQFYYETAWALENSHDDGKWLTNGSANTYTADGAHAAGATGNSVVAAAIDPTKIFWP